MSVFEKTRRAGQSSRSERVVRMSPAESREPAPYRPGRVTPRLAFTSPRRHHPAESTCPARSPCACFARVVQSLAAASAALRRCLPGRAMAGKAGQPSRPVVGRSSRPARSGRAAGAFVAVPLLAFAALVAVPMTASAQSGVWSATLTLGSPDLGVSGGFNTIVAGSEYGSISDATFVVDATTYTIKALGATAEKLSLAVSGGALPLGATLRIDDFNFVYHVSDATRTVVDGQDTFYRYDWDWQSRPDEWLSDSLQVGLIFGPVLQLKFTGSGTVAFGGTANFQVIRLGDTRGRLDFKLHYKETGWRGWYYFAPGHRKIGFRHRVIDLDRVGNAFCTTTMALEAGPGYELSPLVEAQVLVSGPNGVCASNTGRPKASFSDVPTSHDSSPFSFTINFDIAVDASAVPGALWVTNGQVTAAETISNQSWSVEITPYSLNDVKVHLPVRECGEATAICTSGDEKLARHVLAVVPAAGLSVGQSPVAVEGLHGTLDFDVTLVPAATTEVTVDYATSAITATVGDDYTETIGTLTFNPGDTTKTIAVPIVDDNVEDDLERFRLTLSNPSGAGLIHPVSVGTIRNEEPAALTASFEDVPASHDGASAFTFRLAFSEEIPLGYKRLRDAAFRVTNGAVTAVRRVTQGENRVWEIKVTPAGGGDVTVALPETTDCAAAGAICAADQRMLAAVSATVPETAPVPFLVRLKNVPDGHDGTSEIVFEVEFTKEPHADYSYKTLRDSTVRVRQGGESLKPKVRRLNKPHNDRWEVKVTPGSKEDLTVLIGPFSLCSDEGAVCTAAGEVLANKIEETIEGTPGLSVADARVHESVANAAVEFAVTLSRASAATVTVAYATSDGPPPNGATAEDDYEPRSGTLTFLAGETSKTVSVPVVADDHDEGEETLVLTLSNPTGGAWLKDATATGTIENTGPMPRAWLARFGRTVAEQVIDAVEGRFSAQRRPGVELRLAGQAIGSGSGAGALDDEDARAAAEEARSRLAAMTNWLRGEPGGRNGSGSGAGSWDGERSGDEWRSVLPRELLTGTSFALTGEAGGAGSGTVSLWGRGAVSRFDGREGELTLSGEVTSAMLGADWMGGPGSGSGAGAWTAGLLVSHSRGEGSYRGANGGTVSSTLTGLYPYGRYEIGPRLSVWGVAGYGAGSLTLAPDGRPAIETDMDLKMGAAGVRGVAVEAPGEGGVELSINSDALAVRTSSEASSGGAGGNLAGAEAEVTRLRLGLEGSWRGLEAGGGELVPRLEVGVRHDGGDAETGFGLDVGGGLSWSHPASGLSAELSGRGLLTHESRGFRDRGLSGSFGWEPGRGSGRGPKVTLTQTVGTSASGGMDALLRRKTLAGLAADDNGGDDPANRRLELRMGYGFAAFGDRFTSTPELGLELGQGQREVSLGWRLNLARSGPVSMELGFEAIRREHLNDNAVEHGIGLRATARW